MTSKDRVLSALARNKGDRLPFFIMGFYEEESQEKIQNHLGVDNMEKVYEVGMRIYTLRHAFNLREGINPLGRNVPGRIIGDPPLKEGNVRDVTVDYKLMVREFLELIGWDTATTVPGKETLRKLDLEFLIDDLT